MKLSLDAIKDKNVFIQNTFGNYTYSSLTAFYNNNKPTSQVLSILKGNAGKNKGKYQLYSVGEKVTNQSQRYSDWYDSDNNCNTNSVKYLSTIDHVLVTSNL